ncbi:MAG: hypothetical protein U0559_18265 [Anaerolineae bacterium]
MADLMTLTCPSCGGQLQITNETDRFVCAHCGNSHVVDPGVRMASLAAEVSALRAESESRRLSQELSSLVQRRDQLRSEVKTYRSQAEAELYLYQAAGTVAYVLAFVIALGSLAVLTERPDQTLTALAAIAASIFLVAVGRNAKRLKLMFRVDPRDDVVKEISDLERQIAHKQRKLDTLQRRMDQDDVEELISDDLEPAARIKQYASRTTPS